jgi:hypothetical protein
MDRNRTDEVRPVGGGTLRRKRLPWHGWVFASFVFVMLAIAAFDFVMLIAPDEAYVRQQGWGESGLAYFSDYPAVPRLIWGTSIAAGIAAVVLLAARIRYAFHAALIAAGAQATLITMTFAFMGRMQALGVRAAITDTLAFCMSVVFAWYCNRFFTRRE